MRKEPEFEEKSALDLISYLLEKRKEIHSTNLITDSHNRHFHELVDTLLWKHSEAHGKYNGCRYWSERAIESRKRYGKVVTSARQYHGYALRHEHLFPRRQTIDKLFSLQKISKKEVKCILEKVNIGVVITESEHQLLADKEGNYEDPWKRYKAANIKVINTIKCPAKGS